MQIKVNTYKQLLIPVKVAIIMQKVKDDSAHCWQECELIQPLWEKHEGSSEMKISVLPGPGTHYWVQLQGKKIGDLERYHHWSS